MLKHTVPAIVLVSTCYLDGFFFWPSRLAAAGFRSPPSQVNIIKSICINLIAGRLTSASLTINHHAIDFHNSHVTGQHRSQDKEESITDCILNREKSPQFMDCIRTTSKHSKYLRVKSSFLDIATNHTKLYTADLLTSQIATDRQNPHR